jgi:hypothetical protein
MFETGNLMELLNMNVRHLLVAVSAAAILAGSSYGALAGGWNYSKGQSSSGVVSVGVYFDGIPLAVTLQGQKNKSVVVGNGAAGADASTHGGATAGIYSYSGGTTGTVFSSNPGYAPAQGPTSSSYSGDGRYATAGGSTHGSSCAGNAC